MAKFEFWTTETNDGNSQVVETFAETVADAVADFMAFVDDGSPFTVETTPGRKDYEIMRWSVRRADGTGEAWSLVNVDVYNA